MPNSLAFPDKLPLPLLSRHRLSADLLALLYLHAVDEHAEVLADRNQRRMLSCIFTRSAPLAVCETSATARRTSGGSVSLSTTSTRLCITWRTGLSGFS